MRISIVLALLAAACGNGPEIGPVWLTFGDVDASRSVVVQWLGPSGPGEVRYDAEPRGGVVEDYARRVAGEGRPAPDGSAHIHAIEIAGLDPGAEVYFVVGAPEVGWSEELRLRTAPAAGPISFVAGGDVSTGYLPRMTSARAAERSPHFALLGGDIAYGDGRVSEGARWRRWLEDWSQVMRTPEGFLVPLIVAVGHHEIDATQPRGAPSLRAPWWTALFRQAPEGRSWFERRFGGRVQVLVLDSGHLADPAGAQRAWLEGALGEPGGWPARFAVYHQGLYPSHHPFERGASRLLREQWLPLFDRHRLTAGFEAHDHAHKRTHPLRAGRRVAPEEGTLYLGDGCWGKSNVHEPDRGRDYLAAAERRRHFWHVRVGVDAVDYAAVAPTGEVFDATRQPLRAPTQ